MVWIRPAWRDKGKECKGISRKQVQPLHVLTAKAVLRPPYSSEIENKVGAGEAEQMKMQLKGGTT